MDELERAHFGRIAEPAPDLAQQPAAPARRSASDTIVVWGLDAALGADAAAQDAALREFFRRAGGLTVAETSGLGKPRRFGFVRFANDDDVRAALALPCEPSCPFASAERAWS